MKPEQSPRIRNGTVEIHMRGHGEAELADDMDTVFFALHKLRSGELESDEPGSRRSDINTILTGLELLTERVTGVRDAVIRLQAAGGGTVDDLMRATGVPRSTAGYRRKQITTSDPSLYENWATGELAMRQQALFEQSQGNTEGR